MLQQQFIHRDIYDTVRGILLSESLVVGPAPSIGGRAMAMVRVEARVAGPGESNELSDEASQTRTRIDDVHRRRRSLDLNAARRVREAYRVQREMSR